MIDADKYEGHTKGHWTWMGEEVFVVEGPTIARIISDNKADANLMADAPLLLEEVKELREELRITQRNLSIVRNALALGYPDIEEAIWKLIGEEE
jgi:hypothetical protein